MSAFVRHAYAGICLIQHNDGVCELHENGALLARTDNTAIADKLFFKRALEAASGRVGNGARVQLTTAGKMAFGCAGEKSSATADAAPPLFSGDGDNEGRTEKNTAPNKTKRAVFQKPTVEEITEYCLEKGYTLTDPQAFYDRHESAGWMVGRVKMRDWKAAVRTWEHNEKKWREEKAEREKRLERPRKGAALTNPEQSSLDFDGFERDLLKYRPKFKPPERNDDDGHLGHPSRCTLSG